MLIESSILSSAFASLSIVYQAYSRIKSNRERCGQLVERCQLVVDRLQAIVTHNGESAIQARIKDLEHTFKLTADTITKVGQQGLLVSLLRSEENAALIEDCQHALTTLVSVLSLEQIIDLSAWRKEDEISRRRDHQSLLNMGRKLELGNSAILTELAHQGATLAELSRALRKVSTNLGDAKVHRPAGTSAVGTEPEAIQFSNRARAMSFPSVTQSSNPDFLEAHTRRKAPDASDPDSSIPRSRMSWASKFRGSPLSFVSKLPPWGLSQTRDERGDEAEEGSLGISHAPPSPPPAYRELDDAVAKKLENTTEETFDTLNPSSFRRSTTIGTDKPLPDAPSASQTRSDRSNSPSIARSISPNMNGPGLLIEMLMPPGSTHFGEAVPFTKFVPLTSNRLDFVNNQLNSIREIILPFLQVAEHNKARKSQLVLLCPEDAKAKPLLVKSKHSSLQNKVKAYVLTKPVIVISARFLRQRTWYFMAYDSELKIRDVEHNVRKHYDRSLSLSGWHVHRHCELERESSLSDCGINAYEHQIEFKLSFPKGRRL